MMTREEMWFGLCSCQGIYRTDIERILKTVEDISNLYGKNKNRFLSELAEGSKRTNGQSVISHEQAQELRKRTEIDEIRRLMELNEKRGIRFLSIDSADYPKRLLILKDAPYGIYVKGAVPSEEPTCGMVGARACSAYGRSMSEKFAAVLARGKVQIISGMALGIDAICSRSALSAGGKTFVVLGGGVDVIYPKENTDLYYEILMKGGGILSEYPPGTPSLAWQFPHRNRLIAALSDLLLVMEARKQSGTLSTVGFALDMGKDVYALPGRVTDPLSESCNLLIREGAGMLTTPEEVLSLLTGNQNGKASEDQREQQGQKTGSSDPEIDQLYEALDWDAKSLEEIAQKAQIKAERAAFLITFFVLEGLAKEVSPGYYVKT